MSKSANEIKEIIKNAEYYQSKTAESFEKLYKENVLPLIEKAADKCYFSVRINDYGKFFDNHLTEKGFSIIDEKKSKIITWSLTEYKFKYSPDEVKVIFTRTRKAETERRNKYKKEFEKFTPLIDIASENRKYSLCIELGNNEEFLWYVRDLGFKYNEGTKILSWDKEGYNWRSQDSC